MFTPIFVEMIQFDDHIFQRVWFNHQLVNIEQDLFFLPAFFCSKATCFYCNVFPVCQVRSPCLRFRTSSKMLGLKPKKVEWNFYTGGWLQRPVNAGWSPQNGGDCKGISPQNTREGLGIIGCHLSRRRVWLQSTVYYCTLPVQEKPWQPAKNDDFTGF